MVNIFFAMYDLIIVVPMLLPPKVGYNIENPRFVRNGSGEITFEYEL